MPTYQYVCSSCDEPLEAVQAFTDDALTMCPACGQESLRKVYGSVGVVFKGSGFYRNDARTSNTPAPSSTSPAAATPSAPSTAAPAASTAPAAPSAPSSGSSSAASSST